MRNWHRLTERASPRKRYALGLVVLVIVSVIGIGIVTAGAVDGTGTAESLQQGSAGFSGTTDLEDAETKYTGERENDSAGLSVADAGDVNGDGVDDLLIGAPLQNSSEEDAGAAYIVFGPADPGTVSLDDADVKLSGVDDNDRAGYAVSTAGDVNGDGIDDVIVGAPGYDGQAGSNTGAAYIVYGNESLPSELRLSNADSVITGSEAGASAGFSVADVNDSASGNRVLIGAPFDDENGADSGVVYLVESDTLSETVDLDADADARFIGEASGDRAGWAVSTAGDVDDGGTEDIVIGAPKHNASDGEIPDAGAAYIASSAAGGAVPLDNVTAKFSGAAAGDQAGYAVADAGDFDNDTVADVVIGAPTRRSS